jgi:hypothetical protein
VARRYHQLQKQGRGHRSIAPGTREGGEALVDLSEEHNASRVRIHAKVILKH